MHPSSPYSNYNLSIPFSLLVATCLIISCQSEPNFTISSDPTVAQPITISYQGPMTSENAEVNPFMDYRLITRFSNGESTYDIPGYYAADGNASETSSDSGNIWRVHFTPPRSGEWTFKTSFRKGTDISTNGDMNIGEPIAFDGAKGAIQVNNIDMSASGFYAKGKLEYQGNNYLQHTGSGDYFIKGGAGSPENLLGYIDFDGTAKMGPGEQRKGEAVNTEELHRYTPHVKDWKQGDPSWQNGKGKGIIGGMNYLASKGVNSMYFLVMNINGDGKDVWPYTHPDERFRFDCSKLDQWNILFDHMDRKGILLHIFLQETENETLLDNGDTGPERKAYLREMIARYGHHLGVIWNMGEENGPVHWSPLGQSTDQQKAMLDYIASIDPYDNLRVIHSHSDMKTRHEMFDKLLDHNSIDGMSMQIDKRQGSHEETKIWLQKSAHSGQPWHVAIDEIGHFSRGMDPDDLADNNQDSVRKEVTWGHLMAGGQGVEWYFGYINHDNDLGLEDWRSRDRAWDHTHYAVDFFNKHLPFWEMSSQDELVTSGNGWCFAKSDEVYVVYLPNGGNATIDLTQTSGTYSVQWYNPRSGGALTMSNIYEANGGESIELGNPPSDHLEDWTVLVKKK